MKKVLKILLTVLFVLGSIFAINRLTVNYSNDGLFFIILAITAFLMHLFAWIAPKRFFDLCWKMNVFIPDFDFDYDTSYKSLSSVGLGILITANIIWILGVLVVMYG